VNVRNKFCEVILFLRRGLNFINLQHQQIIFKSNGDIFLIIAVGLRFFVGLLSEINEPIDEADFNLLELLSVVLKDEAIKHPDRSPHPRVEHVFHRIL